MEKISILWDLDGTIIDSADLYYEAYRPVFKKYHLGPFTMTEEEYRSRYFGQGVEVCLSDHIDGPVSDEQMAAMKWDYLLAANKHLMSSPDGGIRLLPGVEEVINAFFEKGYPMAIASTSWLPTVVHSLEKVCRQYSDCFSQEVKFPLSLETICGDIPVLVFGGYNLVSDTFQHKGGVLA